MNKFGWQNKLQASLGNLTSTVTGLSENAASKLKPWSGGPGGPPGPPSGPPAPEPGGAKQYLRLPIDSARKLRFYDRPDLTALVEANLRERQELQDTIEALKRIIVESGVPDFQLSAELAERLADAEQLRVSEEGVNAVLLEATLAELAALRGQAAQQQRQIGELQARLETRDAEVPARAPPAVGVALRVSPADGSVALELHCRREADSAVTREERSRPGSAGPSRLEAGLAGREADSAGGSPLAEGLQTSRGSPDREASPPPAHQSALQSRRASSMGEPAREQSVQEELDAWEGAGPEEKLQVVLGKLERAQADRRQALEEANDASGRAEAAEARLAAVSEELSAVRRELVETQETAAQRLQELRGRVGVSTQQHAEVLRRAQDICTEAETRAEAAERRLEKAEARCVRAEGEAREAKAEAARLSRDLKTRERERDKAEAALAEARQKAGQESGRAEAVAKALEAARRASEQREAELLSGMRDGEARLRDRIARLEEELDDARRVAASGRAEAAALERRVAAAEDGEAHLMHELREAQLAAAERDELAARVVALEERLGETRAERGQLQNYKALAAELEGRRVRVEEEVLATARMVTALEGRLRAAEAATEAANMAAAEAKRAAMEAESRVAAEVEARLQAIGPDRSRWPAPAREEAERLEKRLEIVGGMLEAVQRELEAQGKGAEAAAAAAEALTQRLAAAEEAADRAAWGSQQALADLQAQVAAQRGEAEHWRREADRAVTELGAAEQKARVASLSRRTSSSAATLISARSINRGGGSLQGVADAPPVLPPPPPMSPANGAANGNGLANGASELHSSPAVPSHQPEKLQGVDMVYLKNVVLKFVEATAEGKTAERDALLPAIAALLQASPQEFRLLRVALTRSTGSNGWLRIISAAAPTL